MKFIKIAAAALLTLSSLSASAGLIKISGGQEELVPTNNKYEATPVVGQFKTPSLVAGQKYTIGGNLLSAVSGRLELTFSFLGDESGWHNVFQTGNQTIDNQANKNVVITTTNNYSLNDPLDFIFYTLGYGTYTSNGNFVSTNGYNLPKGNKNYNFAIALNSTFKVNGQNEMFDAILFLDDTGPAIDDDNHDDLVIGLKVRNVPEPSVLLLLTLGMLSLVGARRMKA